MTSENFIKLLSEIEQQATDFYRCIVYLNVRDISGENYLVKFSSCYDLERNQIYVRGNVIYIEGLNEVLYKIEFNVTDDLTIANHYEKGILVNSYTLLNILIDDPLSGKISNNWTPPSKFLFSDDRQPLTSNGLTELEFLELTKKILQNEGGDGIFKIQFLDHEVEELREVIDGKMKIILKLNELKIKGKITKSYDGFTIFESFDEAIRENSFRFIYNPVLLGPMMSWYTTNNGKRLHRLVTKIDFEIINHNYGKYLNKKFLGKQLNRSYYNDAFIGASKLQAWQSYSNLCFFVNDQLIVNVKCDPLSPSEFFQRNRENQFVIKDLVTIDDGLKGTYIGSYPIDNSIESVLGENVKYLLIAEKIEPN